MVMGKGCNQEYRQRLGQVGWHYPWRKYGFYSNFSRKSHENFKQKKKIIEVSGDDISAVALVVW